MTEHQTVVAGMSTAHGNASTLMHASLDKTTDRHVTLSCNISQ